MNSQKCADQPRGDSAEHPEGAVWPRPGLRALRRDNRQKGAEEPRKSQAARRASNGGEGEYLTGGTYGEDGIEWVGGRPVAGNHPNDREGAEQL